MQSAWFRLDLFTILSGIAIMIMAIALWKSIDYRRAMPPGEVRRTWRALIALIALFFLGYLALPFFVFLPAEAKDIIVSLLFFLGALYVIATLNLIYRIVLLLKKS